MLEAGVPNSEYVFWIGAFAPAATPRPTITTPAQGSDAVRACA